LLVLLDRHRVMTTLQLSRATGAPERTVRYRMERLQAANLVDCARPGRERGSSPRHWWLRPSGARLMAGTAAADGHPSGMFVAHAATIAEVWLALVEHGGSAGIEVDEWLTDRAGWQEWTRPGRWTSHPYRLTPDAVASLRLHGSSVVAFVEVDLASMTQTLLKQKVARYLAYAADRAWENHFVHCPPMLLLTTTPTRAATFARIAGQVLGREPFDLLDPGGSLVVAGCGLVRDPAGAVVEPCWTVTELGTAELTLAELLAERVRARTSSEAWFLEQDTVVRRRNALDTLREVGAFSSLGDWFGSEPAAELLRLLIGSDPAGFLDGEPELSSAVVDWFEQRRRLNRFRARDLAQPIVAMLAPRHSEMWASQVRRVLAADAYVADDHPRLHRLVRTLASEHIAPVDDLAELDVAPARTRAEIQTTLLGTYVLERAEAVEREWMGLDRRTRRRVAPDDLTAAYDREHLTSCEGCGLLVPLGPAADLGTCTECGGALLSWSEHPERPALTAKLDVLRTDLAAMRTATPRASP
jgi:hypothetical protein